MAKESESGVVTVACKIPNGLLLRVGEWVTSQQHVFGGGVRDVKEWVSDGQVVEIKGPGGRLSDDPDSPTAIGYALTYNVNAEFMAKWFEENKSHNAVLNGQIFYAADRSRLTDQCKTTKGKRTGYEPINVKGGDPRVSGVRPFKAA